jgi:spore germination protein YaaH
MNKYLINLLFFGLGLFIGIGLACLGFIIEDRSQDKSSESTDSDTSETTSAPSSSYILNKEVSAYLVWWDQDNGFSTLQEQKEKISIIHPFWYQIKSDGSIVKSSGAENDAIEDFARQNLIKIIPVISNDNDPDPVEQVFVDDALTAQHVDNIVSLVKENNFDGIEIDYESLEEQDRADFSAFMTTLSEELHAEGKLLTTAVHAKTSDEGTWGGPASQDWAVFNSVCDRIKIMTYDFHWSTSEAGNIAPLSWMREVLDYGVSVIDEEKIDLGIHFYGYDWEGEQAETVLYSDVQDMLANYNQPTVKLSSEKEKYFTYTKDNAQHTVYFSDEDVVAARVKLVDEYSLAGIGIWRIGQEDPDNWVVIEEKL